MKYLSITEKYDAILKFDEILNSSSYHYKARIKAAYALARISQSKNSYRGLDFLIYYFRNHHYAETLKPNKFGNEKDYFIYKAVLKCMALV